jgi:hypothetical protein
MKRLQHKRTKARRKRISPRVEFVRRLVARGYSPKRALAILRRYERFSKFRKVLRYKRGLAVGTPATFNQEGKMYGMRVKAKVTAVDFGKGGWGPNVRTIRYEAEDGSWAWMPGNENIGDVIWL